MKKTKTKNKALMLAGVLAAGAFLGGCQTNPGVVNWDKKIDSSAPVVQEWTSQDALIKSGITGYPFYYDGEITLAEESDLAVWQDDNFFYQTQGSFKTRAIFGIDKELKTWEAIRGTSHKTSMIPLIVDTLSDSNEYSDVRNARYWVLYLLESELSGRTLLTVVNPENNLIHGFISF